MTPISLTPASTPAPVPAPAPAPAPAPDGTGAAAFAATLDQASAGGPRLSPMALNNRTEAETRAAIHKSAGDFEATCFGQLMGFMTQEIAVDPIFGGGHGEEMYRDMMNAEYGKLAHKTGSLGLAAQVERELLRAQGLKPLPGSSLARTSLKV